MLYEVITDRRKRAPLELRSGQGHPVPPFTSHAQQSDTRTVDRRHFTTGVLVRRCGEGGFGEPANRQQEGRMPHQQSSTDRCVAAALEAVITSYSIHYTKLYDIGYLHLSMGSRVRQEKLAVNDKGAKYRNMTCDEIFVPQGPVGSNSTPSAIAESGKVRHKPVRPAKMRALLVSYNFV